MGDRTQALFPGSEHQNFERNTRVSNTANR